MDCKKGGLFTTIHNKLRDVVTNLAGKDFNSSHVRCNPLICRGHAMREGKAQSFRSTCADNPPARWDKMEQKRDPLIRDH